MSGDTADAAAPMKRAREEDEQPEEEATESTVQGEGSEASEKRTRAAGLLRETALRKEVKRLAEAGGADFKVSAAFVSSFAAKVFEDLEKSVKRAKANGRHTLLVHDTI